MGAVRGLRVEVRFALDDRVPLGAGSAEHVLDLLRAHRAASAAGAGSVVGAARTGTAGVRATGVARGLLLLGAFDDDLGLGFGEDFLVLLLLLHLIAVDGLDLVGDLLLTVLALGLDLGLTLVEGVGPLLLDLGLDRLLLLDGLVLHPVDGENLAVGDIRRHRHGQEVVLVEFDLGFAERILCRAHRGRDLVVLAVGDDGEVLRGRHLDVVALVLERLIGLGIDLGVLRVHTEVGQRLTHGVRVGPLVGLLAVDREGHVLGGVDRDRHVPVDLRIGAGLDLVALVEVEVAAVEDVPDRSAEGPNLFGLTVDFEGHGLVHGDHGARATHESGNHDRLCSDLHLAVLEKINHKNIPEQSSSTHTL